MVDDAVGISRTAVQALVDKVKSAFKEEAELWQIVQRDMVFIQDEFEMMESFLSTADGQIVMNSNVVRTWVRQVCDLSHQVEDCAEFLLHLDTKRSWWAFSLRLLPSWCKSGVAQPLDEAVAEIKLLKARVEEVSQRNMRYNLIGDSGPNAAVLMQQQKTAAATSDNIPEASKHQVHSGSGFLDLTKLLTKEDMDLQVISVCGTGGDSGGLSIIRKAYDESRANKDFKCYAWVKLMYPLRSHDFIDDLLAQFYTNSCQQKEQGGETIGVHPLSRMEASACELGKEFKQQVDKHRYLIILEDLSSLAQLDAVRTYLPDMKNGSRIVVSTQQLEIASLCTGKPYRVSELSQFSDDHSVLVFFKEKTSQNSEGFLRNEVKYRKRPSSVRESASDWMNNCFLVGRDQEVDSLYEMITNIRRSVVSVFGTAGVGKSCLVQTVYNRLVANRQYEQFDMFSWVNIYHPLDPTDFSNRLLLDMARESTYHLLTKDTIEDCRNCRSLIVIDGLQFKEDWDSIYYNNLELRTYDSCIIVITTDLSIATYCANSSQRVCEIKPLEDDVALDLFRKVFPYEHSKNKEAIREGEVLLPMCGGLPSRIVALASHLGSLAKRPRGIQEGERERLTANFMQELTMAKRDSFQSIFARMRYRFEGCPQLLKRCIFYLRIFPENSNIQRRRLVRRWMAEGYSKGIGSNSMEEDAEKLFDKTAALGMIQQAQWRTGMADDAKKKAPWQVNYLFLEYIISWQKEEKNFFPLEVSVLEGRCSLTTGRVGQHLAICNSWERDEFVFHSLDLSRLRSLTVSGEWSSFFISDKMRVLRVLDLEGTYNLKDSDLEQIGEMLPRLKFLSLRRCKKVSRLPDSLGHLRQLETLDIRDTRVIELPRSIIKLHKLQYLRARTMMDDNDGMAAGAGQQSASSSKTRLHTGISKCFKPGRQGRQLRDHDGVTMPRGIGRLMALRKLGVVDVTTAGDEVILAELHNLKQLNSLHMSGIPRTKDETMFLPPFTGQSLNNNIRFPQNLMKVKLDMPKYWLRREDIQAIGRLEKMHTLRLHVEDIQGGLPYFLRCMQERGDAIAGTSLAHPFGQLKLIEIDCIDMYATFYEDATLEQPKLSLKMMISLRPEELQDLGKLKWIHTLCLYFSTIQLGGLLFAEVQETTYTYIISRSTATADSFGLLKVLEIACRSSLTVKFAERTMKELEKLKFDCFQGSELQLSGLEHLPSLKEVWLKGSFDNKLVEGLQRQLENHQNRPVLKQE